MGSIELIEPTLTTPLVGSYFMVVSELVNNLDHALPVRFVYEVVYIGAICRILEAGCLFLKNFGLIFVAGKIQNQ